MSAVTADAGTAPPTASGASPVVRPEAAAGPSRGAKLGFLAMVFGMFMAILDIQIVSSSLRDIQAGLAASADEIAWIQTSYLIAEVVMIPLSGYLSRLFSTRWLFVLSCSGFTLASLGCASVSSIEAMIVWRVLQGFLGGAMIPTAFATSFTLFPPQRRAAVGVVMGLVATMAPTIGPSLGGWITQSLSWHWLFLINLVPGVLVTLAVASLIRIDRPDWSLLRRIDLVGLAAMAVFLGGTEYVLDEGPRWDWLDDRGVRMAALAALAGGAVFFWRAFTRPEPIVELRAFADRNFAIGCILSFVLGIGLYGSVYLMPLFLGTVRHFDALEIGQVMFVVGAFQFLSAPLAGALSKTLEPRVMLSLGLVLFGTGVWLQHILTNQSGFWEFFLPQAIRGVSLMLCFLPINQLALGTLPPDKLKNGSGLYNLMRNLGGAVGLAAINTVLADRLYLHEAQLKEWVSAGRPVVEQTIARMEAHLGSAISGDPHQAALAQIAQILHREAYVLAFSDCLLLMAGVFLATLLLMPLVRKPRPIGAAGGGH
jgi:DHA2 family multidrug resistance protein